jgi:multisubunit Na+/H+ antiporter MnhB subunit
MILEIALGIVVAVIILAAARPVLGFVLYMIAESFESKPKQAPQPRIAPEPITRRQLVGAGIAFALLAFALFGAYAGWWGLS